MTISVELEMPEYPTAGRHFDRSRDTCGRRGSRQVAPERHFGAGRLFAVADASLNLRLMGRRNLSWLWSTELNPPSV